MTQSHDEMLARVRALAADYGYDTWECDRKDKEALRHVLAVVNELCACLESSTGIGADEVLRRVSESVWQRVRRGGAILKRSTLLACKYCKTDEHLKVTFPNNGGGPKVYVIACCGCGTQSDTKGSVESARDNWNWLQGR